MTRLLGEVLPLALGAAVSPVLLTLQILVLAGRRSPLARALAVVVSCTAVLLVFAVLAATVLTVSGDREASTPYGVVKAAAAVLLVYLAARQLFRKPTAQESNKKRSASRLANAATPAFLWIGALAMLTNFTTLILYIPAVHAIVRSSAALVDKVVVFVILVVIVLLPVLVPFAAVAALGERVRPALTRVGDAAAAHSRQVAAGLCLVFAALLGWQAVQILA